MPSPDRECTFVASDCKWSPSLFIPTMESLKEYVGQVNAAIESAIESYEVYPTPIQRMQVQNAFRKMEMASKQVKQCEKYISMAELP